MGKNKYGNITKDNLQDNLKSYTDSQTEVLSNGKDFYIHFIDNNRYYVINENSDISGPVTVDRAVDKYPGDITKDIYGNDLSGDTEENAYQINCIEDLCAMSNIVATTSNFNNKYFALMRDLDFKSDLSYINGYISIKGDIPSYSSKEELMERLTTGDGFVPIAHKGSGFKGGNFNGNFYTISNLYENYGENNEFQCGLFSHSWNAVIQNLVIEGNIITAQNAGGIIGGEARNTTISNCVNKVNIISINESGWLGGIASYVYKGSSLIRNCFNYGNIGNGRFSGGILGCDWSLDGSLIYNCFNAGNGTIGILGGKLNSPTQILNCFNYGTCSKFAIGNPDTATNCFYLTGIAPESGINSAIAYDKQYMKSETFVNELNNFIETGANTLGIDTTGYAKWIYQENNFPTLDFRTIWNGTEWE